MTWKLFVGTLLVGGGLAWSGCEPFSESSKTSYTGPSGTSGSAGTTDSTATTAPAGTTDSAAPATTVAVADGLPTNIVDVAQWPSYYSPAFFQHGTPDENGYRQAAVDAAKAQGANCIKCDCPYLPSDEVAFFLMHFEHPTKPGYYAGSDNWYNIAADAGIHRWIYNIGDADATAIARWKYLTKSYPANSVQWILYGHTIAALP